MTKDMNDLCRGIASNAMMISVYTDELRNDYVRGDESKVNDTLTTMVRLFELWLEDY